MANLIIYDSKIVEVPSIIEIRSMIESEEWDMIVSQTVDFYMQLKVADETSSLDDKDKKILRKLNNSLKIIKNLDPINHDKYYDKDKIEQYKEIANKTKSMLEVRYGDKPDGKSDIIVSRLD